MSSKLRVLIAAASVCSLGLVISLASVASGSTKMTVKVVEHATNEDIADVGATGDSEGGIFWFANPEVYDSADSTIVGHDQGMCFRTSVTDGAWECNWTTFLEDGQITVEGPFYDAADSVLAVTGGTGAYKAAQGVMKLHGYVGDDKVQRYDFVFKLILP